MIKLRKWSAGVAVAVLAAGSAPGLAWAVSMGDPATFQAQPNDISRWTAAAQMTKDDPVPSRAFASPYMLADPDNPRIIVASTAELLTRVCYLERSTDGGQTWHILPALPAPAAYPFCTNTYGGQVQGLIAWGRNHTLYYALQGYSNADGGGSRVAATSILLARSTDLGNSWSTTIVDNSRGRTGTAQTYDGPMTGLAVDTSGSQDVVYVGFGQSYPNAANGTPQGDNSHTMVATSTDGGKTFGTPVDVNTFSHVNLTLKGKQYPLQLSTPFLAASSNGVVVAVSGPRSPATIPGSPAEPILAARSTDQGKTWTVSAMSPDHYRPRGPTLEDGTGWTPLGGPQGTFVSAYAGSVQPGAAQIFFQRSTDGGQTWSTPVRINDDDISKQVLHFMPELSVAPNGRVDVAWYDFRQQHGFAPDIYYTYSSDAGATWAPNVRATDQSINFTIGVSSNSDVRQPPGIASANQYAAFGWADTRLGNVSTQTQDNFGDVAQFTPLPASSSNTLPVLASIFGGLVAAGVVMMVVLMGRRRRQGPTPAVDQREPATTG